MVVGNGLVAKKFLPKYGTSGEIVIFASGVSNSKCTDEHEFEREYQLVEATLKSNSDKCFVYFSTCSVYDKEEVDSAYVIHKKKIESLVSQTSDSYHIFRVSNLVGESNNSNTILNYLFTNIQSGISFNLWKNASRNLIDADDMYRIVDDIICSGLHKKMILNIANTQNYTIKKIVSVIEEFSNKKANYIELDKGYTYPIDTAAISSILQKLDINFSSNYLPALLNKYYSNK